LEITDAFIDKLVLPVWFFPAAIVLLLIGFAVVIAQPRSKVETLLVALFLSQQHLVRASPSAF